MLIVLFMTKIIGPWCEISGLGFLDVEDSHTQVAITVIDDWYSGSMDTHVIGVAIITLDWLKQNVGVGQLEKRFHRP